MDSTPILEFEGIRKSFGPVQVLRDISLRVERGTVHALCGENGAGKSTLMKILAGVHAPDGGTMRLDGRPYSPRKPLDALEAGVSMFYQETDLAEDLTVAENLFLGHERMSPRFPFMLDSRRMREEAAALIRENGFPLDPDAPVSSLSVGEAQLAEILKALHRQSKVLVMDEPTSALSEGEAERLFSLIGRLREKGITILYISHRMEEIRRLADVVSVLRDGTLVSTRPIDDTTVAGIIHDMVGRELSDFYPKRHAAPGAEVFSVTGLSDGAKVRDVSFSVRAGEIVGMAGLVGSGRTETADAIFGVSRRAAGEMRLNGKPLDARSPADAIRAGIAYLTEDRKRTGLCTGLPCGWNITLPNLERLGMPALLDLAKEREAARRSGESVRMKWGGPDDPADTLSGGNQQKLLLARWLMAESDFLIFDEPTRGIDVGAKTEVYALLADLAAAGKAILLISSDLPEVLGVCDRVLVMRDGRLAADLPISEATPDTVMKKATS